MLAHSRNNFEKKLIQVETCFLDSNRAVAFQGDIVMFSLHCNVALSGNDLKIFKS